MSFLDRFHSFIREQALFNASDRILLAVSGGRDSVLLAHLLQQSGFEFGMAHCNFKLRGAEADQDEQFVTQLAAQLQVPLFVTQWDTRAHAQAEGISIQMAARNLRYQWLEKIRKEANCDYIALAHHQNDTIETMLLNLTRGTGIAGLHGILPKRDVFIRPMLCFDRDEVDQMLKTWDIVYRDDSSNQSTKYARNKIRLEVIPKLKELNPNLEQTFEANRKRFAELELLLNDRVAQLRELLFCDVDKDEFKIDLAALQNLRPLQTLLFGLFSPFGFSETVLSDLTKVWNGNPGKQFESATHTLLLDRNYLLLRKNNEDSIPEMPIAIDDVTVQWGHYSFQLQYIDGADSTIDQTGQMAQLDCDRLVFPLKIRSWRMGDYFYPLGMRGKKKLSDFFIGQKIPRSRKHQIPILQNGNGDILCIIGYRQDERYKVQASTQKMLIFTPQ